MSEFRKIIMSSFLMLLLHFTAAEEKRYFRIVRVGDEVTLTFENVIHDKDKCENTTWYFFYSRISEAVTLFEYGQIHKDLAKAKSDRLRVEKNCSLVIKNVTEDAGRYICRQFRSGQQVSGSEVYLSVVTMTEHQDNDEVTLRCSVKTYGDCRQSVKWLLQGQDVVKDHREINTSQSRCSASVTFLTSHFSNTPRFELFTCEVTYKNTREVHLFPFSPQSSGEDPKPGTSNLSPPTPTPTTTTTTTTTTATTTETNKNSGEDPKPATTNLPPPTTTTTTTTTTETNENSGDDAGKVSTMSTTPIKPTLTKVKTASEKTGQGSKHPGWWWWIIVVIVAVAALAIITVAVIRRKRTQGTETETDENLSPSCPCAEMNFSAPC
ncbi:mucin-5AC-like isoform X2 [Gymnodraco acuticeps]|uniref:Mucin-5AC-like isoform X2 n=1 Tax=Gymnodraco acuticeps TaxID=8218 RepID=A0A6P8TJV3_GYMAC|nr:mucin-5AC-like isoform X2 [Gymnodraco acuticeps]